MTNTEYSTYCGDIRMRRLDKFKDKMYAKWKKYQPSMRITNNKIPPHDRATNQVDQVALHFSSAIELKWECETK